MARKNSTWNLLAVSSSIPWWAGILLAAVLYLFISQLLPTFVNDTFKPALVPAFNLAAYVFAAACLIGVVNGLLQRYKQKAIYDQQTSLETIKNLSWSDFEHLIVEAFRREGYDAQVTPPGPDGGVDVVLEKDTVTALVQCKHWNSQKVGVSSIRELAGVVATQNATTGIFVASGRYTQDAKIFAAKANIRLIGDRELVDLLGLNAQFKEDAAPILSCARCGSEMVQRVAKRGASNGQEFWGCSSYPRCKYTKGF